MAPRKQKGSIRETLSVAANVIQVGGFVVAVTYSIATTASGIPIILTGISVFVFANFICSLIALKRRSR